MHKKMRLKTLLRFFVLIFLGFFVTFSAIHLYLGHTLDSVETQYMNETALLYLENINERIRAIHLELIPLADNLRIALSDIPEKVCPKDGKYYEAFFTASDRINSLKIRYPEMENTFLYLPFSDLLIFPEGISWATSENLGLTKEIKQNLQEQADVISNDFCCEILSYQGENYMLGWYKRKQIMLAYVIDLNQIFREINDMPESYEVISFLLWNDGRVIAPQSYSEEAEEALALGMENVYAYPFTDFGTAYIKKVKDGRILENVHIQLGFLSMEMGIFWLALLFVIWFSYKKLFSPFTQFIAGIENVEKEENFHYTDENTILELEEINRKFITLLHRLKDVRIALYERTITEKQTELELLQEQIRPHFFLNCLNLIHSIADKEGNKEITELLEELSEYIRYLFGPTDNLRRVSEEENHVRLYILLQHKRYGDAFFCTIHIDENLMDLLIPKLMLQTLVENSIQHNTICEQPVEVSLFMTVETIENEEWLYCCVSDTGKGFSNEVMDALLSGREIFWDGRRHIGLSNLKERLKLMYGQDASFSISNMSDHYGAIVEVRIKIARIKGKVSLPIKDIENSGNGFGCGK